jgi:phosphomannomutase
LPCRIEKAGGGIILTASHNPREWNALKLLNQKGEFISAADGAAVLAHVAAGNIEYAPVNQLGAYRQQTIATSIDISTSSWPFPMVDVPAIQAKKFKVVVDAVNSTGALAVPPLLEAAGLHR